MRIKQSFPVDAEQRNPVILLERLKDGHISSISKQHPQHRGSTKANQFLLSNALNVRRAPSVIVEPKPQTQESFLSSLGLKSNRKSPVLPVANIKQPQGLTFTVVHRTNSSIILIRQPTANIVSENLQRTPNKLKSLLLSPLKPKGTPVQSMLNESIDSISSETHEDHGEDLLDIDICSPLGIRMTSTISNVCTKCSTIRDYDQYCNRMQTAEDSRSLRSQTTYCDDRWNLNNIHYIRLPHHIDIERPIVFGRRHRTERLRSLRSGLNRQSRRLVGRMRPCKVIISHLKVNSVETHLGTRCYTPTDTTIRCQQINGSTIPYPEDSPAKSVLSISSIKTSTSKASSDGGYDSGDQITRPPTISGYAPGPSENKSRESREKRKTAKALKLLSPTIGRPQIQLSRHKKKPPPGTGMKVPFQWEDFSSCGPKVDIEAVTDAPQLIDLTVDSDDEHIDMTQLPSPTQIIGSWYEPQPLKNNTTLKNQSDTNTSSSQAGPIKRWEADDQSQTNIDKTRNPRRRQLLIRNTRLPYCRR